jgi:hypothetical protein
MPVNALRGAGLGLPPTVQVVLPSGQPANSAGYATIGAGPITLAAGETMLIPPGTFDIQTGGYTFIQVLDPVSGIWRVLSQTPNVMRNIYSDGANMRLANLSGCAAGALITNVGSGYTSAPTVTPSAGSSTWTAIVGGAINSTVTITTAGAGYTHAPVLLVSAPPVGGVQATAYATVSAGAIATVVVVNQGAGYTAAPTITVLPDPRDTITTPAVLTVNATLTGSGTITGLLCTDHGTPLTAVPTLAFAGGGGSSAAATAVMCFAATGLTVGAGGAAYGNAQPFLVITGGGVTAGTPGAVVNPQLDTGLLIPRQANMTGVSTAGGAVTATGLVVNDAGLFQAVPTGFVIAGGTALATTVAQVTITVGGKVDTSLIYPI